MNYKINAIIKTIRNRKSINYSKIFFISLSIGDIFKSQKFEPGL